MVDKARKHIQELKDCLETLVTNADQKQIDEVIESVNIVNEFLIMKD